MVINIFAMILFCKGIFAWAALVIMFAGIFDIVDGEVARRTKRVTKFGAFFDSVIDRYSDLLLLLGLIIWYAKINRISMSADRTRADRLRPHELYARPRGIADSCLQSGISRKTGADRPAGYRRVVGPDGGSVVGDGDPVELDRLSADLVHVAGTFCHGAAGPASHHSLMT